VKQVNKFLAQTFTITPALASQIVIIIQKALNVVFTVTPVLQMATILKTVAEMVSRKLGSLDSPFRLHSPPRRKRR
jgi:hypothetical protein